VAFEHRRGRFGVSWRECKKKTRVDETGSFSPSKDSPSCRSYLDVTIQIRSSPVVCLSFGVCSECRRTVLVESFLCAVGPR
jgi:hypothetical protein